MHAQSLQILPLPAAAAWHGVALQSVGSLLLGAVVFASKLKAIGVAGAGVHSGMFNARVPPIACVR